MSELEKSMEIGAGVLDCTIRDGSYVVDYQFTIEDTYLVALGLARAGVRRIEVGHGLGLNAQVKGRGVAAISDEEYIRSAKAAVGDAAAVGSFFIPGIGDEESLLRAKDAGLDFIRIGIDVDEFPKLEKFVRLGKKLGFEVWANLMKSYIVTPGEFGVIARQVAEMGADVVALVDSAGGMVPDSIREYTHAAVEKINVPLGFHGHDNLSMAVANCLQFVESGGKFVDGSLAGIGRSGGNAATEVIVALLEKKGVLVEQIRSEDLIEFADIVTNFCLPLRSTPKAVEIATGLNFFHSSFSKVIEEACDVTGASKFKTIMRLPEEARKSISPEIAQKAASRAEKELGEVKFPEVSPRFPGNILDRVQPGDIGGLEKSLRVQKGKGSKVITVTVAPSAGSQERVGPLRFSKTGCVAHIELSTKRDLGALFDGLGEICDYWIVDESYRPEFDIKDFPKEKVLFYRDTHIVACALTDTLQMLSGEFPRIGVTGVNEVHVHEMLSKFDVVESGKVDVLVICDRQYGFTSNDLARLSDNAIVLLIYPEALTQNELARLHEEGVEVWRVDCGIALVSEVERLIETHRRLRYAAGSRTLESGQRVIAGGIVGEGGDFVVDDISEPRMILGRADGRGGMIPFSDSDDADVWEVQKWIVEHWKL